MIKRGNERDLQRAAVRFIQWWREEGNLISASTPSRLLISGPGIPPQRRGWGFDFEWSLDGTEVGDETSVIQHKMEECIDAYMEATVEEELQGGGLSSTQEKKRTRDEKIAKRMAKTKARLAARRLG